MKKCALIIVLILNVTKSYSQDILKIKEIDRIVNDINESKFRIESDTLIKDRPEYGLKMTTYLTAAVDANQLKKYENFVHTFMSQDGTIREIKTSSTFYYDQNELIKVEEYMIEGGNKKTMEWYYSEDKPLFYSSESENAEERALLLVTISKAMLKTIIK